MHDFSSKLAPAIAEVSKHACIWFIYVAFALFMFMFCLFSLTKRKYIVCFISIFAFVSLSVIVNNRVDDAVHHIFKIAILTEQIRSGHLDAFVTNYFTGDRLPVFLYYSIIPYILPVILCLTGIYASYAYKISLITCLALFMIGVWRLAKVYCAEESGDYAKLCAILFISSNYVISLWVGRSAAAELAAYSLVPWVVLAVAENPIDSVKVITLLSLQIAAHPIIFPQCACAELIALWALEPSEISGILKRNSTYAGVALLASSPFWVPQIIFRHAVLGNSGIPVDFKGSFLTAAELVNPFNSLTIGLWNLLAAGLVLGYNAKVLKINQIILVFVGVLSIMMQTVYGRLVAIHIPFLGISQFVWRWMFVSCFIVFIMLLVMPRISIQWMRTLCALSIVNSFAICTLHSGKISLGIRSSTNENIIRDYYYDRSDNVVSPQQWGLAEYFPDYSGLRPDCGVAEGQSILSADFSELEQGLIVSHVMSDAYVTVKEAPVQFVRYVFDGVPIGPRSVCDGRLIFGPFRTGGLLSVDESLVYGVMTVRYLIVVMLVIGGGLLVLRQRDRPGVNAP